MPATLSILRPIILRHCPLHLAAAWCCRVHGCACKGQAVSRHEWSVQPLHRTPLRVTTLTAMILNCHTGPRRQRGAQPAKPTEDSTVGNKDCRSGSWREKLCFHCHSSTEHVSGVPTPLPIRGFSKGGKYSLVRCMHTADIS